MALVVRRVSGQMFYGTPAMLDREKAEATFQHVVNLLAAGDYDALARLSTGGGISAENLRCSVEDYGQNVVATPFEPSVPEPLNDGSGWWADVDLHTEEEGLSDLTLSLTLFNAEGPLYDVRLDNLHVL